MAFRFGASPDALERDFGVIDIGEKAVRMQLAHYFGWSLAEIDDLTPMDWLDALAYMNARAKVENSRHG